MFTKLAIILAATFLLTQAAHGATGTIEATVCMFMDIVDENGNSTGLKCIDCGDGCLQQITYPESMNAPPEQVITIVDAQE